MLNGLLLSIRVFINEGIYYGGSTRAMSLCRDRFFIRSGLVLSLIWDWRTV